MRSLRMIRNVSALLGNKMWQAEMSLTDRTKYFSCLTICLSLTLLFLPREAFAACDGSTGTVTCTGSITSTIGTGPNSSITTLNIASGASVNTSGLSVSTGSGASADNRNVINVNGSLQSAGNNRGPWNEGRNVVEFKDYTVVNISSTGSIVQTNTATNTGGSARLAVATSSIITARSGPAAGRFSTPKQITHLRIQLPTRSIITAQ
ncbi:hypothetical protein CGLAMM_02110 [Acetobacteraceae bacterium EV16G]